MISLTGGRVQNQGGAAVPNGSISFQLNLDATVLAEPGGLIPSSQVLTFQFDATGNLVQPAQIYSNAELEPQNGNGIGSYYIVNVYDANGAVLNQAPLFWQFTQAANSTVDISTMTPYFTGGSVIYYASPASGSTTNPAGSDTDIQYNKAGAFGGDGHLIWNYTDEILTLGLTTFTAGVANSPSLVLAGSYETASTYAEDSWSIENVIGSGVNGAANLTFTHSGSTDFSVIVQAAGGSSAFQASANFYQLSDTNEDAISSVINDSTPAATTQWFTTNASVELGSSGSGSFITLGAASGPTVTIECNEFAPFGLVTGSLKFLNALVVGGALEDGTNSAGSNGNVLTSTGTATVWTDSPLLSALTLSAATPSVSSGQIGFGTTTDTSASAGSNGAVPSQVVGYLEVNIGGTMYKVPYFAL